MIARHEILPQIVDAIAEAEERPPHELDYSLHDHVETEALLNLVTSDHTGWRLTFQVPDHTVEIRGNGQILVDYSPVGELESPSR